MFQVSRSIVRASLVVSLVLVPVSGAAQSAPTPEEHFGFSMGTADRLARWDGILEYFEILAATSDRIQIDTLGPTTLGNPFVAITLTSPENLQRLAEIQAASATLAQGRISEAEAESMAAGLPATVLINHNIHSTEIGSSQTSVDLVHLLATSNEADVLEILDDVVTVLIPSANPDGQIMVTDWAARRIEEEMPKARMPFLYHHYAGHDNNRDFFQGALVETRYWFDVMYHRTAPQIYLDQHQMGGSGARMFVPPYPDPMNPLIHPLMWQGLQFIGGGIVRDLQAAGKQGVMSGEMYRIFGQEGALTQRFHNVIGLLTETASANLATPDTVELRQLTRGTVRREPNARNEFSISMPDPWQGGEWALADIVSYQTVAAFSVLKQAARYNREYVLGRWQMASETMQKATENGPYAFVIPSGQADELTTDDLIRRLAWQGIEIHQATEEFEAFPTVLDTETDVAGIRKAWTAEDPTDDDAEDDGTEDEDGDSENEGDADDDDEASDNDENASDGDDGEMMEPVLRRFPAGSYVVRVAQPSMAAVMDLLEPRFLPVRREYPGGPFLRMYDGAAYTMSMQMGVETVRVDESFSVEMERVMEVPEPMASDVVSARRYYAMSSEVNQSYAAANALMADGFTVQRAQSTMELDGREMRGAFLIPADQPGLQEALMEHGGGVTIYSDPSDIPSLRPVQRSRVGLYQGHAGSMDEGWTRLFLEEYGFDHRTLSNEDVRDGDLDEEFDVIIIPAQISLTRLINGLSETNQLEEFTGGIGDEGVENLKSFVENGGTLVTLDQADELVLQHFDVPIRNALSGVDRSEFFLPSSLLNVEMDPDHDLTAGSPGTVIAKWAGGRVYEPTGFGNSVEVVGRWADAESLLAAGQLVGADMIAGKGAILDVAYGEGRILMYGFRVKHRMQTHGTFKLLFNALISAGRPIT